MNQQRIYEVKVTRTSTYDVLASDMQDAIDRCFTLDLGDPVDEETTDAVCNGTKLQRLESEAFSAAQNRGHYMFRYFHDFGDGTSSNKCVYPACDAQVVCRESPSPNEVEIGGTAVALDCPASH